MKKSYSEILLLGENTCLNKTIFEIVASQNDLNITHVKDIKQLKASSIQSDLIVADLVTIRGELNNIFQSIKREFPLSPVLAIHYHSEFEIIQRIKHAGADAYLNSEMNEDELLSSLRDLIH